MNTALNKLGLVAASRPDVYVKALEDYISQLEEKQFAHYKHDGGKEQLRQRVFELTEVLHMHSIPVPPEKKG